MFIGPYALFERLNIILDNLVEGEEKNSREQGWQCMSRESGIYRDVDTREVLHSQYDPWMTHWLYTKVVRSMLVYSSLVWWPKPQQITASRSVAKIQRAAPLEVLGVVKGTPTTKMEVIQYFPSLDILIKGKARMSAYRLQCNGSLCYHQANKHSQIGNILQIDILGLMSVGWHRKLTLTNHTV